MELDRYLNQQTDPQQDDYDSDDDYATPPNTPPGEVQESEKVEAVDSVNDDKFPAKDLLHGEGAKTHFIDQEFLTERMLWDKMYERYHLQFEELQVLIAPKLSKWESCRFGARSPLHLVERFSVDLTVERRVVPTTDPTYPALMLTGNLPHLTLHISHMKVSTG